MHQDTFSKVNKAYIALKQDIINLHIAPDFPLKITWLQEAYNFGATPLREALSRLEREHWVKLIPNKGYYTSSVSYDELVELYNNRRLFKQHLLKEAIVYGDKNWEAQIVATHYRLSRQKSPASNQCSPEEYDMWVEAHDAFDAALMSAHQSQWVNRFNIKLTEHIRRQGRAFLMIMPDTMPQDFATAATRSPALQALYAIEIYTELKDAALSRNFEKIISSSDAYTDLVLNAYEEIQNNNNCN